MTKKKCEGPGDPLGLSFLVKTGESLLKWLWFFVGLSIILGLSTLGFAVAWLLK